MKNISLILNILLLVAVAVLYFLHFSGNTPSAPATSSGSSVPSDIKIAYVNSDSITKHYDFLKEKRTVMDAKTKRLEGDFEKRALGLQSEFQAYQRNVNNMTLGQVKATEEDLAKKQQNLQLYQQRLNQEVMQDEARIREELYNKVTAYLKKYSEEKGLHVIMKYDPTSDILAASNALDVTDEVIKGLNAELKGSATTAAKTDSTGVK